MAADPTLSFMLRWFIKHDKPPTVRQVWKAATKAAEEKFTSTNNARDAMPLLCVECEHFDIISRCKK